MIQSNIAEIQKELQDYKQQFEQKLKAMVAGFAGDVAFAAGSNTKVIDSNVLESSRRWQDIYAERQKNLGIDIAPGYHAGAWQYTEGQLTFNDPSINNLGTMQSEVTREAQASYKVGDKFAVGLVGPAAAYAGPSENEIDPMVQAAYKSNLKRYFESRK